MIPDIGIMIGAYIVTRMIEVLKTPNTTRVVRASAITTLIVAVVMSLDLLLRGVDWWQFVDLLP
jgi:hypothetical protein